MAVIELPLPLLLENPKGTGPSMLLLRSDPSMLLLRSGAAS